MSRSTASWVIARSHSPRRQELEQKDAVLGVGGSLRTCSWSSFLAAPGFLPGDSVRPTCARASLPCEKTGLLQLGIFLDVPAHLDGTAIGRASFFWA